MLERTCRDCENRPEDLIFTRRQFLNRMGLGFGALSLTSLVGLGVLPAPEGLAAAATIMMNTGSLRLVKPSVGSWVTYGLGTENQNLPGFISLAPGGTSADNLRCAFLPGAYQGTSVNTANTQIDKLIENIKSQYV